MDSYAHRHRSMNAHMVNKTDRAGRLLTEQERIDANPNHPAWRERAQTAAQLLRSRIGLELHRRLIAALPLEADGWSDQRWYAFFRRCLELEEQTPFGRRATLEDLLVAVVQPIYLHPLEAGRLRQSCPGCSGESTPDKVDQAGMHYSCRLGHTWERQDETITARWAAHVAEQVARMTGD